MGRRASATETEGAERPRGARARGGGGGEATGYPSFLAPGNKRALPPRADARRTTPPGRAAETPVPAQAGGERERASEGELAGEERGASAGASTVGAWARGPASRTRCSSGRVRGLTMAFFIAFMMAGGRAAAEGGRDGEEEGGVVGARLGETRIGRSVGRGMGRACGWARGWAAWGGGCCRRWSRGRGRRGEEKRMMVGRAPATDALASPRLARLLGAALACAGLTRVGPRAGGQLVPATRPPPSRSHARP